MSIHVLIIVNNVVICEGLRKLLPEEEFQLTVMQAPTASSCAPNIILFDSLQDIKAIINFYPAAKLVVLDLGLTDRNMSCLFLCYHINGIIAPDTSVDMFRKALKVVDAGQVWIDQRNIKSLLLKGQNVTEDSSVKTLSHQDRMIVQLITQGDRNKEIADKLDLSEHTIRAHISRIYRRLHVQNRAQLVSLAKECELNAVMT